MRFQRAQMPSDAQTIRALRTVGGVLGRGSAYVRDGGYWFVASEDWALGVFPDDAGRFRLRACYGGTEVATMWALAKDLGRLADLTRAFKAEITALRR